MTNAPILRLRVTLKDKPEASHRSVLRTQHAPAGFTRNPQPRGRNQIPARRRELASGSPSYPVREVARGHPRRSLAAMY
jgi:hypothetical protein